VLGEKNENEGERNIAFPLKTPCINFFIKEKLGTQSLFATMLTTEVHS
jgi:hypothetical protein